MVKKATRVSRFVSVVEDRSVYVGLDVHKKTYSVALFEPQDGLVETWTCPATCGAARWSRLPERHAPKSFGRLAVMCYA